MTQKLIHQININGLEWNKFRDPDNYRRAPGEDYRFKIRLRGSGTATARLEIDNQVVCEEKVELDGIFNCTTRFDSPGARVAVLTVEHGDQVETRRITIDVWERQRRDHKEEVPPEH